MNPFFFGSSQQPLFGIHHPAKGDARGHGVVLCPPIGQEYMRTHRALRQLALQLNKAGFDVLRFDYAGIGDSAGDNTLASLEGWQSDTHTAIDELKDTAGVKQISVVGVRIGASLAYLASRKRSDIDCVVLWDPVVSGSEYVDELVALADEPGKAPAGETIGVTGFALTAAFRDELCAFDLTRVGPSAARRLFQVASEPRPAYARARDHFRPLGAGFQHADIPSGANWDDAEQMGAVLLPQAIIQGVVLHLSQPT